MSYLSRLDRDRHIGKKLAGFFARLFVTSVVFCTATLTTVSFAAAGNFPDVPPNHPSVIAITYLTKQKVLSGYPDGTFRPDSPVNRAEALKILLLANGDFTPLSSEKKFPDVATSDWFASFVSTAAAREVAGGYPDGFFRPAQKVNLVEGLKILLQAAEIDSSNYKVKAQLFADTESAAWYNQFLAYSQRFNLVKADVKNRILPATALTRAELAEIVYRFVFRVERVCSGLLQSNKITPSNYFVGVKLASDLPSLFYENEIFSLSGSVVESATSISAFFINSSGEQTVFTTKTTKGNFSSPITFGTPGHYVFSVTPNFSDQDRAINLQVLPRECIPIARAEPSQIQVGLHFVLENNLPLLRWDASANNITRVILRQGSQSKEYLVTGQQNQLKLSPRDFSGWIAGPATVQIFGAKSEHGWGFEPRSVWSGSAVLPLQLTEHHFSEYKTKDITVTGELPVWRNNQLNLLIRTRVALEPSAYLINPKGLVEEIPILKNTLTIPTGSSFNLRLNLPQSGAYILELNDALGLPVLNHPLYELGTAPLLPDYHDLRALPSTTRTISLARKRAIWLRLVNDFRAQYQLPALSLDDKLTRFSQAYAERMAKEGFFGHADPEGRGPEVRRLLAGLPLPVGENLAMDAETAYAHAGLLRSAIHRANLLDPNWTVVGLGIALDQKNNLFFAQNFSTTPLTAESLITARQRLLELVNQLRAEKGLAGLALDLSLEKVAQSWSVKMLNENFFDFSSDAESLQLNVRDSGFKGAFAGFIAGSTQLTGLVKILQQEQAWQTATKTKLAIGLMQRLDGTIMATFIFH